MSRAAKPQISFADWELLQQGISQEPLLQSISDFLDDHEDAFNRTFNRLTPETLLAGYSLGPALAQGGSKTYPGISQSQPRGAASDARNPADDATGTT